MFYMSSLLLRQDDRLPNMATITVVETGEQMGKEGAGSGENQGVSQQWIPLPFKVQVHVKVDHQD